MHHMHHRRGQTHMRMVVHIKLQDFLCDTGFASMLRTPSWLTFAIAYNTGTPGIPHTARSLANRPGIVMRSRILEAMDASVLSEHGAPNSQSGTRNHQKVAFAPRTDGRAPYMQAVRGACRTGG